MQSLVHCGFANTVSVSPLARGFSASVYCNIQILSGVICLLRFSGPFTIVRIVALTIVNTVDRMCFRWLFTHIREKFFKRVIPFITNGNTSTPVIFKIFAGRVVAPFFHFAPANVFYRICHPMRHRLSSSASTRFNGICGKVAGTNRFSGATVTQAIPVIAFFRRVFRNNGKFVVTKSCTIYKSRHNILQYIFPVEVSGGCSGKQFLVAKPSHIGMIA